MKPTQYEKRVREYEAQGMTRSDAQGVVDAEIIKRALKRQPPRVVVYVEGGNVQAIYSNRDGIAAEVVDFDNLKAEGKDWQTRSHELHCAVVGMKQIY